MNKKLILSGLTAVLLSACGGSGGDSTSPVDNPTQRPNPSTDNTALTITPRNMNSRGIYQALPKQGSVSDLYQQEIRNSDRHHVGTAIQLPTTAADAHQGGVLIFNGKHINYNRLLTSDNSYRYVQFGTLDFERATGSFVRFDTVTPQLPTQGHAHYQGDSILDIRDTNAQYLRTEIGTVAASVDFGARTMRFEINSPSHRDSINDIKISKDGGFLKDATGLGSTVGGGFVGPNGEEMMGSYSHIASDYSGVVGVFGAKRQ